jgi:hypothetical protein
LVLIHGGIVRWPSQQLREYALGTWTSGGGDLALWVAASIAVAAIVAEEPASSMFMGMITKQTPKKGERFTPEDGMVIHANPAKYGECAGGPISPAAVSRSNSMRKDVSSRTGRLTTFSAPIPSPYLRQP